MFQDQDPLHYLPLKSWGELQNAFKADWTRGISGFAALDIQSRWARQGKRHDFKVYCPFGDVCNGMIVVNEKAKFYEVIILCPRDDTEKLGEALRGTKIIDWNREVIVPYAPQNVIDCLKNIAQDVGVEVTDHFVLDTFILEEITFEDVSLPPNITFGPVTSDHIDLVDSVWPHRYPNSQWYFEMLINANSGFGLYLNNSLISWVFFKEVGALQHLYTVEEHRHKGYAELLMKLASKIWMTEGKHVFGYCFKNNVNACKLYKKLGFVQTAPVAWYYFNKKVE